VYEFSPLFIKNTADEEVNIASFFVKKWENSEDKVKLALFKLSIGVFFIFEKKFKSKKSLEVSDFTDIH
jgi:hypothetical protein